MDHLIEALQAAGWRPRELQRRLHLFDLRAKGIPMLDCVRQLADPPYRASRRTVFYDWSAIRRTLAASAAPEISETKARLDARLERIYTLAMGEIARRLNAGDKLPSGMLREARQAMVALGEMYGAIDRRPIVPIGPGVGESHLTKTDAELDALLREELRGLARVAPDAISDALAPTSNGHTKP